MPRRQLTDFRSLAPLLLALALSSCATSGKRKPKAAHEASTAHPAHATSAGIHGRCYVRSNGLPSQDGFACMEVQMVLYDETGIAAASAQPDQMGSFDFPGPLPGRYTLRPQVNQWYPRVTPNDRPLVAGDQVEVLLMPWL